MPAQRRVQQSTSMRMHFSAIPADSAIFAVKSIFYPEMSKLRFRHE